MLIHNIFRSNIHCVSAADDMLVRIFIMVNFYNSFTPIYISCSRTYMYLLFDLFWRSSEAINLVMVHFTLTSLQLIHLYFYVRSYFFWSNFPELKVVPKTLVENIFKAYFYLFRCLAIVVQYVLFKIFI